MSHPIVGLVPLGSNVRNDYQLVYSSCNCKVLDIYSIAEIVQDYYSSATVNREIDYVFPTPPGAVVCSFKTILDDDKIITGITRPKAIKSIVKAARDAEEVHDGAFPEEDFSAPEHEHEDVFRIFLGTIKPKQKISVYISFISIVPHNPSSLQSFSLTLPTAIAQRHGAAPSNIPWFAKDARHRFELTVSVQTNDAIISIESPSHPIKVILGRMEKELKSNSSSEPSAAFIHFEQFEFLDKNVDIVISAKGLDVTRCNVERWLASDGAEETTDAYALTLVPKFDTVELSSQEYVFIVDRSGSMRGARMEAVKTALQMALRSLPSQNTYFNIVSFCSSYTPLWPRSRIYNAETMTQASRHIDRFIAGYAGTELRSALQFAFSSRISLYLRPSEERPAASVFVLTDGEAWDLDGIVDLVAENSEAAKKQDSLLRTFILGVGNQVSIAMCEAIARAGKGGAVFAAEGENADAKLMSLLTAARGGVIEDFAVEWTVADSTTGVKGGIISIPQPSEANSTLPDNSFPPPTSFNKGSSTTKRTDVGLHTTVIRLPPPSIIQQAPRSDNLPVPLYPGFRCSIFVIVKQSQNSGTHSPIITMRGKVLGKEIVLKAPVNPVATWPNVTPKSVKSRKLLHTLAARALIQVYDEMLPSPEAKAQIERLQKRYSLATSCLSFLAVDQEFPSETYIFPDNVTVDDEYNVHVSGSSMWQATLAGGLSRQSTATFTPQATVLSSFNISPRPPTPSTRPRLRTLQSTPTPAPTNSASAYLPTFFGFARSQSLDSNDASPAITHSALNQINYGPVVSPAGVHSPMIGQEQHATRPAPPVRYTYESTVGDAQVIGDNVSKHLELGEVLYAPNTGTDFLSLAPSFRFDFASKQSSADSSSLLYGMPIDSSSVTPALYSDNNIAAAPTTTNSSGLSNGSSFTEWVPTSAEPVGSELLARLQKFDGSLPNDPRISGADMRE